MKAMKLHMILPECWVAELAQPTHLQRCNLELAQASRPHRCNLLHPLWWNQNFSLSPVVCFKFLGYSWFWSERAANTHQFVVLVEYKSKLKCLILHNRSREEERVSIFISIFSEILPGIRETTVSNLIYLLSFEQDNV